MSLASMSRESEKGLPNSTLDRTAGSHSLAAAGQRERWTNELVKGMDKILAVAAWPGVALVLGLATLFLLRAPIAALIGRTKRLGKTGLETFEGQAAQPAIEKKGVDQYFKTFENPMLLEQEQLIVRDLKDRGIDAAADREKALVRALASTQLVLRFEVVYGLIWASQVSALRFLNPRDERGSS